MKRLSRKDLEAMAERVVRAYMKLPELQNTSVSKIDPEVFSSNLLHLNVQYARLTASGTILGLTSFEPTPLETLDGIIQLDSKTVLIESALNDETGNIGRRNFTIMHEACHQVLKMFFPNDYGRRAHEFCPVPIHCCRAEPRHRDRICDWEEWQTNALASAVFLPRSLVDKAMDSVGLTGKIKRLNKLFFKDEYEKFLAMTEILGCSQMALSIRMKQLGLIGESYLDNPYRMLDVEVD